MIEINSRSFDAPGAAAAGRPTIEGSRQDESLADFANGNPFGRLFECCFEPFDWFAQRFEAQPESLMMHRHDESRAGGVRHLNCLLRCAMRSDPGIVCADGHDRQIDRAVLMQVGEAIRQRGVPSENNAPSISLQKIAVVTALSVALLPRAPVVHAEGDDVDVTCGRPKCFPRAPTKLRDIAKTCPS